MIITGNKRTIGAPHITEEIAQKSLSSLQDSYGTLYKIRNLALPPLHMPAKEEINYNIYASLGIGFWRGAL